MTTNLYPLFHVGNNNNLQPMNWNYTQTVQITTQINPNNNYQQMAKEFLEKYANDCTMGIQYIENYYSSDTLISLHMHQYGQNYLYELIGHNNFKNRLYEIGIHAIKYNNIVPIAQPLGKKKVIITFYGFGEISGKNYNIESTIIFKLVPGFPKITNHCLNIFL